MSVVLRARCRNVHLAMCDVTTAVSNLAASDVSNTVPSLITRKIPRSGPQLINLHDAMAASGSTHRLLDCVLTDPGMSREHALFITDFTALLTALVPQIDRVGRAFKASKKGANRGNLKSLWMLLSISCLAFRNWPANWPGRLQLHIPPLQTACINLLVWLLQFTRSPAWALVTTDPGGREESLINILSAPLRCFINISLCHAHEAFSQLSHLHPDFLPIICCIASEQLSRLLPASPRTKPPASPPQDTRRAQGLSSVSKPVSSHTLIFQPLARSIHILLGLQQVLGEAEGMHS